MKKIFEEPKTVASDAQVLASFKEAFGLTDKTPVERMADCFQTAYDKAEELVVCYDADGNVTQRAVARPFAMDEDVDKSGESTVNSYKRNLTEIKEEVWSHFAEDNFIGWQACSVLAQNPLIHLACHIPAEDAIACGYKFVYSDNKKNADETKNGKTDNDYLSAVEKATESLHINEACVKLNYNKRVFGTGIAFPEIYRGNKRLDMDKPFNADGIKKGDDYRGWKVVDPYWLLPVFEEGALSDPTHDRYMRPSWYQFPNGRKVHHTWFIKVDNVEVPDILKPTYRYGGVPLVQHIYKRVWCAEKTANEAPLLALSKRMLVVDANVQQIIKDSKYVKELMDVLIKCRNNWGVFFKTTGTELSQIDTSLGEFDQMIMTQYQLIASIAQMPATKLLQTTPTGFQSTGEFEWKIYAQLLQTAQHNDYRPLLEKHALILSAVNGKKRILSVVFNPVDAPSERERADIEATKASTRSQYVSSSIVTADEVRNAMRNDEHSEFSGISAEYPDKEEKDMEAELEGKFKKIAKPTETKGSAVKGAF